VSTQWDGEDGRRLVDDYLSWLSPYLLTLPDLPDAVRATLEVKAAHHALLVDAMWRLYPRMLDQGLIQRARIEAQLRRAAA
jgi:plasmid stability protein